MVLKPVNKSLKDLFDSFEGVLRHIGIIFSANAVVAILGLFSLILLTQSVGPLGLGLLALVEAYPRTIDQVFRFEPSQAVIRYGTRALEIGNHANLRRIIKWATVMDIVGASIAALIGLATLHLANRWLGFSSKELHMALLFTFTVFSYISATSVAVFRLLSKFEIYAKILVISALIKFLSIAFLWWMGAGIMAFFYAIALNAIIQHLLPFAVAWRLIVKNVDGPIMSLPFNGVLSDNPGILRFIFNANANVLSRNASRQFDVVLLGGLVSHTEIGLYQMAKRVALAAIRFSRPIEIVVFPKFTQLWERGQNSRIVSLVLKFNILFLTVSTPLVLFFWIWGDTFIELVFGPEFIDAKPLLIIQLIASALFMTTSILNSALLSIDQDKQLLIATLISSGSFFLGILLFVPSFGIIAASWLTLMMNIIWVTGCSYFFYKATR